jgi:glucokinase
MITIAADLGGTRIKLGIVRDGEVIRQTSIPAQSQDGLSSRLAEIAHEIDRLLAIVELGHRQCHALGLTFPGLVNAATNRVRATYGKWDDAPDIDLGAWSKTRFGLPLVIENDTRLALLGEWTAGAGIGCNNLVLVTLGTGLGTAAVVEGHLLTGVHGQAGILGGHFCTNRQGGRCNCGNVGCAESEASTWALARIAESIPEFQASALRARDSLDYSAVFELARQGDACAQALKAHALAVWAQMIVNLIHAYDPERVILGGGIAAGAGDFFDELKAIILSHAHTPWGKVDIVLGKLGQSAALLGLDALARRRHPEMA